MAVSDIYLYEDVPVLKNKLEIRDEKTLDLIEAEQSRASMMILYERGFSDFTPAGLCEIHRFLFGDIYDWAGKYRLINIESGSACWVGAASGTATMKRSQMIWRKHSPLFQQNSGSGSPKKNLYMILQGCFRVYGRCIRSVKAIRERWL